MPSTMNYHSIQKQENEGDSHQPRRVFPIFQNLDALVLLGRSNDNSTNNSYDEDGSDCHAFPDEEVGSSSHQVDDDQDDASKQLCEKLNKLSMEERTQGIHELHGVADIETEKPDMMARKLQEMSQAVNSFDDADTEAYRIAMAVDSSDTGTYMRRIKLLCLRADYYDSRKAASRMVSFFTFKHRIFIGNGDMNDFENQKKLARVITLDDLDEEDIEQFRLGRVQLFMERDRAGRAVVMASGAGGTLVGEGTWCRLLYYVTMSALRDIEIQKKGIVYIHYAVGQKKFASNRAGKLAQIWGLLPLRLVGMHFCYDEPVGHQYVKLMSQAMESHYLCRFRSKFGSFLDCVYHLMTFGIPKEVIPINIDTGDLELQSHLQWLEMVRAKERFTAMQEAGGGPRAVSPSVKSLSIENSKEIAVLGPMDVIVGRGSKSKSSAGYLRLQHILQENRNEYEGAGRNEKTGVAKQILDKALAAGCRFVRWTPQGFVECDALQSREKIAHAFRNMRRTEKDGREKAAKRGHANVV